MKLLSNAWHRFDSLTSDVFWNAATSYPTLFTIGLIALAAFVVAHLPFIERLYPPITPYIRTAALVSVVSTAMLLFLIGFRVADQRDEAERLRNELAFSNLMLESMTATAADADRLRQEADAKTKKAKDELNELRSKYGSVPTADRAYPREFLEWLRTRSSRAK